MLQFPVRTRRSNSLVNDSTFEGVLKCFSNSRSTKNIIKKIGMDVAQLLLAHAFLVINPCNKNLFTSRISNLIPWIVLSPQNFNKMLQKDL